MKAAACEIALIPWAIGHENEVCRFGSSPRKMPVLILGFLAQSRYLLWRLLAFEIVRGWSFVKMVGPCLLHNPTLQDGLRPP